MRRTLTAAVVLLLAGCGGQDRRAAPGPTPTASAAPTATATAGPPSDAQLLQQLLDRRASALTAENARAYAATSAAGRRAADRRAVARARRLGVRDVRLTAEDVQLAGRQARLKVRLTYGVAGVPGSFGGVRRVRASRGHGGWRIAGWALARDLSPWEADDYTRIPSRHFVVWMPVGLDPGPLPAALEDGYARMRALLKRGRPSRRYLVVVARDADRARALTGSIAGVSSLTALTDTEVRQTGASQRVVSVSSQRLIVVWSNFTPLDPEAQRVTVAHELTHAVLAPLTSGRTPAWLTEGVAMYVSGDRRAAEAAQLPRLRVPTLRRLSAPDAIGRLEGDAQREAYAYASAAAFFIADRYGRGRLLALYNAYNRGDLRGRAGDSALTDAAVRRVLKEPLSTLERDLRDALYRL